MKFVSHMHRALPLTLCCLCLTGCVSHTRTADQATFAPFPPPSAALPPTRQLPVLEPLFHEDEEAFRGLVKAAFDSGVLGQPLPERVLRRWEPLERLTLTEKFGTEKLRAGISLSRNIFVGRFHRSG